MGKHFKHLSKGEYAFMSYEIAAARRSYYFWWWKYLRLSENYWYRCRINEESLSEELNKTYEAFGNVYESSFEDWWVNYGTRLFSRRLDTLRIAWPDNTLMEIQSQVRWLRTIVVPMFYTKSELISQFRELLKNHEPMRPDAPRGQSEYEVSDLKGFRKETIINAHRAWCLNEIVKKKSKHNDFDRGHQYSSQWIAKRIGVSINSKSRQTNTLKNLAQHQSAIRVKVSRYLAMANNLISGVERGTFPSNRGWVPNYWSEKQLMKIKKLGLSDQWVSPEINSDDNGDKFTIDLGIK